jgi:hypothetical protein
MRVVIGIDPGAGGGIGVVIPGSSFGDTVMDVDYKRSMTKMPATEADLVSFFQTAAKHDPAVFMEKVHAMPGNGVVSMFSFGENNGSIKTALAAAGLLERVVFIRPQEWQKSLGCLTKGDKKVSKKAAETMFPNLTITHATADALLIAEYGRRVVTGEITRHETATVARPSKRATKKRAGNRAAKNSKAVRSNGRSRKMVSGQLRKAGKSKAA